MRVIGHSGEALAIYPTWMVNSVYRRSRNFCFYTEGRAYFLRGRGRSGLAGTVGPFSNSFTVKHTNLTLQNSFKLTILLTVFYIKLYLNNIQNIRVIKPGMKTKSFNFSVKLFSTLRYELFEKQAGYTPNFVFFCVWSVTSKYE